MLDPINQLFLTLVKLKLNLKLKDLASCFGISPSVVSSYHHLKEIDWTPSVNQVISALSHSFNRILSTFINGNLLEQTKISIMEDRRFTIKYMVKDIGIELNIPSFMEGHAQLQIKEVQEGRRNASVCIHVERAIGQMKNFAILQGTFPISMSRIINQVVCVFLTNFMPALLPPSENFKDEDVDSYFQGFSSDLE